MTKRQKEREQEKRLTGFKRFLAWKMSFYVLFVLLLSANIFMFAQSVSLSDELVELETRTRELRKENTRLEQEVFTHNSLTNLEELADQLGFTQPAEPLYLDAHEYALVP